MSYYLYCRREGVAAEFFFIFEYFEFFSYRIRVLSILQNETVEQKDEKVVGIFLYSTGRLAQIQILQRIYLSYFLRLHISHCLIT